MQRLRISCPPCLALWGAMVLLIAASYAMRACEEKPPEGQYVREGAGDASKADPDASAAKPAAPERQAAATADAPGPIHNADALRRAGAIAPPTLEGAGLRIPIPPEWSLDASAASAMRLATYVARSAGASGDDPTIVFYYFGPGQGGTAEQNLLRWSRLVLSESGEPTQPDIEAFDVGPLRVTTATLKGTYLQGPPGGATAPRRDWALVGAVVEGGPAGSIFARLVGPREAALAQRPVLLSALRSITLADQP